MREGGKFKRDVVLRALPVMLFFEVVSLFFLGLNPGFSVGLLLGTAASILNFFIMSFAAERVLSTGRNGATFSGFFLRLAVYGGAFYLSAVRISLIAGLGTGLGFLTAIIAVLYLNGLSPILRARRGGKATERGAAEYEEALYDADGNRRYVFVKTFTTTRYVNGRTFVTHKRFRRLRNQAGHDEQRTDQKG
jgi:hypothetical protein